MKRLIIAILAILALPMFSAAQDEKLMETAAQLESKRISANIECSISTHEGEFRVRAEILVEGNCYYAKSSGLRIFCDGSTRWTVDDAHKEVYIERSEGLAELESFASSVKDLKIRKIDYFPISGDKSSFTFDTGKLGNEWIITDLRQE